MSVTHKALEASLSVAPGERAFIARITSSVIDRDGEVVLPLGMNSVDFEKNPVVFLGHDYKTMPIGRVTSIDRGATEIKAKVVIAERPKDHQGEWIPDTVLSLIQQGIIRGVSIGFIPTEARNPTTKDKELFGENCRRVISKWRLLELSVAPLPANQDALILAVSKGIISQAAVDKIAGKDQALAMTPAAVSDAVTPPTVRRVVVVFMDPRPVRKSVPISERVADAVAKARGRLFR